ncbi:MAG: hypothetical protein RLZZ221_277 [Verrucomicrobiota bacterium]
MPGGELRAGQRPLVLKEHVAGEEDRAVLVMDLDRRGAGDVAGRVEDHLDLVLRPAEVLRVAEGKAGEAFRAAVDLLVREERIVRDTVVLTLAHHHARGVVQHALDEHAARRGHDHGRVRLRAEQDRQAADVVEVAVGDDDQVQPYPLQRTEIGGGRATGFLRVETAVDQDVEASQLDEQRVGADAAIAVQVD